MQPQGTSLLNTVWIDQLTNDINKIDACAQLQAVVNLAMATLQAEISAIEAQIAALIPLIIIPTNLAGVIAWITKFINPQIQAYLRYLAQLEQLVMSIAKLTQAIESAAQRLTHCSISVPALQVNPELLVPTVVVTA